MVKPRRSTRTRRSRRASRMRGGDDVPALGQAPAIVAPPVEEKGFFGRMADNVKGFFTPKTAGRRHKNKKTRRH